MSILSHSLTYADLERKRASSDERLELIEGEIVLTPSPTPFHQMVNRRLNRLLDDAVPDPGDGLVYYAPLDVYLDESTVLQPDLLVLLGDRARFAGETGIQGPPTLAIEIASPSTASRDLVIKRDLYARHGVPEYWVVLPDERTVIAYGDPADGKYQREVTVHDRIDSATIPKLSVDLAELFAPATRR